MKEVGKVTHYYGNINVAILELSAPLTVGDKVKFVRNDEEFDQEIASMQVEHEDVEKAKKGDVVGTKVDQKVKEGATVYKVEE